MLYEFLAAQTLEILDLWKKSQDYASHSTKRKDGLASVAYAALLENRRQT
jgi:hypothetical protein